MYSRFFTRTMMMMIVFAAAAAAAVSGAALAQNQTSDAGETLLPPTTTTNATSLNMTLDGAKEQYMAAWNQTEFNATFSTFVEPYSAAGYGVYQEHSNVFRPGEIIMLYVEPVGFGHMPVLDERGNALYLMNMTADYSITSANGTGLELIEDVPVGSIVSHRANTELFLELSLTQEQPFPVGDYLIRYVVTDEVSGESFTLEKEIRVAAETTPPSVV